MPLVFTHGETSKKMLQIDWDHPVYAPEAPKDGPGNTVATPHRGALPLEEALREIAGDDARPLLVLRECFLCQGTDLALLSREFANERTILLTSWFHCVKLPADVTKPDHPFHALFPDHSHLWLARPDGSDRYDFTGSQSQQQLWKAMGDLLRKTYQGNPSESVKELLKLLPQFDVIDDKETRLLKDLDGELETRGARSARVPALQAELKELGAERQKLLAREKELRALALAEQKPVPTRK
jgi:hypothetical protein